MGVFLSKTVAGCVQYASSDETHCPRGLKGVLGKRWTTAVKITAVAFNILTVIAAVNSSVDTSPVSPVLSATRKCCPSLQT